MKYLLLILTIALTTTLEARENQCLNAKEVKAIFSTFKFYQSNAKAKKFKSCDASDFNTRTVKALIFLKNTKDDSFSNSTILNGGAFNYFKKRIKKIRYESDSTRECKKNIMAYVYPEEKETMHVCPLFNKIEMDHEASSVLVHEARHTEGYDHVNCIYRIGSSSCDESYEEQGAYGLGTSYLFSLYRATQDPVEKQGLRSLVIGDFLTRFNKLPLDIKQGSAVQSTNGTISFFDGSTRTTLFQRKSSDIMTMRLYSPTFYTREGKVQSYVYGSQWVDTEGDFAKKYREDFSDADHKEILDVVYNEDYSCMLFSSRLECDSDVLHEIKFSSITPLKLIHNEQGLSLVSAEGRLYALPAKFSDLQRMNEDDLVKNSLKTPFHSAAIIGNIVVVVDRNGVLSLTNNMNNDLSPKTAPAFNNTAIKNVVGPFFWSKKLEEL